MNAYFTLCNGVQIPSIGFGTKDIPDGCTAVSCIRTAYCCGYRHIDTSPNHHNEASIGKALHSLQSGSTSRQELFITGKLPEDCTSRAAAHTAFQHTLDALQLEYLDLALLCTCPGNDLTLLERWDALIGLYRSGKTRAIGAAGLRLDQLQMLMNTAVSPMVCMTCFHPGAMPREMLSWCQQQGILVEACSPLGCGSLLDEPLLVHLAQKYRCSTAQLCLRWCLQHGVLPIVKASLPSHIQTNLDVSGFVLSANDMQLLDRMEPALH